MYKTTDVLYAVLTVFQGYCLQYFLGSFLESRMKSRWNRPCVAVLYIVLRMAFKWSSPPGYGDYKTAIGMLAVSLCILSFIALCFYKAFRPVTVFLIISFQAVLDISSYAAVILLDKVGAGILDTVDWCAGKGVFASENAFVMAIKVSTVGVLSLQYLAIAMLLYFSLKKIVWNFHEKEYNINRTELFFILIPAAVGLMICMLLRIIMFTVEDSVPKTLYDRYPILVVVIPVILLLSLLSILCGVKLFQDMVCWNREKSGRIILKKQIVSLQEHMEEMERIYSGIRGMKHDIKNTLAVIQRLSAGNSVEDNVELQAYLSELNRSFENLEVRFKTGNTVVDTLLNMKYHEAVRDVPGLKMDVDKLILPQGLEIHSYDIGVILGNAVDNAMEACRKLKAKEPEAGAFIRLSSLQKGSLLILKVENSFDGRLVRRRQEEFPITDKADKKSHGIGLANIKSTAEKYHGTMDFKVKGRVFILSVMMKNERREENGFWSNR
ncbi:MAG: ATP-binding protein [Lachnospiraceae bacterium]|nr:ATP-binding protein [Lachnospiraceae bacterium]